MNELYICMTSGVTGPRKALSEGEVRHIRYLLSETKTLHNNHFPIGTLSPQRYEIMLDDGTQIFTMPGMVYTKLGNRLYTFVDTMMLWPYLNSIAGYVYHNWLGYGNIR